MPSDRGQRGGLDRVQRRFGLLLEHQPGFGQGDGATRCWTPDRTWNRIAFGVLLINAACPGYTATDLNGFRGVRTPEQGAAIAIRLATLPDDGPTGGFFDDAGAVAW